ncbi:sensor histidine kinase N-terminal domain-containing protein [Acidovorax sp. DW039]|uniref:sensor histidine kinase n=1 Tax=Acidovorax sp. DW039 TaxID=3095606 RepID=UPI00308D9CAE|nr:sensor histidine kinase N-terminal domain-containing protein [Acidovorax sp. DW039]
MHPADSSSPASPSLVRTLPAVRHTLLRAIYALFVLATVVLFFAARSYGQRAADGSYDHLLQASALSMADSVALVQGQWQVDLPYAALDVLAMAPEDRAFYRIVGPDGRTITGYDDLPAPPAGLPSDAAAKPLFFDQGYRGQLVRFAMVPRYIAGGAGAGLVWVQVGQTRLARDALAADIVLRATAAIVALMAGVFCLLWLGVQRALRPLALLEQELLARPASALHPVTSPVPQELAQTVRALNGFMQRLSVNLDALRTFIAEAAHQMRTPLAALIAQAQEGLDDDDPAAQRQSLQAVERNALRLRRLLNQLLSDASVTHQDQLQRFAPVDLLVLLQEALHDVVPRAEPRPVVRLWWQPHVDAERFLLSKNELLAIDYQALEPEKIPDESPAAWMMGDALMLREAFKNLVDNALKHGRPEQGPVDVTVSAELDAATGLAHWCVAVDDCGPGVPDAEQARMFERFARGAGAAPGGAGLGLAIVQRVVLGHGGTLQAGHRKSEPAGTVVGWRVCMRLHAQVPQETGAGAEPASPSVRRGIA